MARGGDSMNGPVSHTGSGEFDGCGRVLDGVKEYFDDHQTTCFSRRPKGFVCKICPGEQPILEKRR